MASVLVSVWPHKNLCWHVAHAECSFQEISRHPSVVKKNSNARRLEGLKVLAPVWARNVAGVLLGKRPGCGWRQVSDAFKALEVRLADHYQYESWINSFWVPGLPVMMQLWVMIIYAWCLMPSSFFGVLCVLSVHALPNLIIAPPPRVVGFQHLTYTPA